ncbi:GNAT family acetyltransferase [Penicillium angulare]|uniref:GNAT family acetyltransferase n=1 Tax=Penicillium angulare TaxID=116970 RepID=A0A9W9FCH8_9EURO|nr:GNAT family acetyltransferase [Penicillium angulare]
MTFKLETVQPTEFLNIITAERDAFENPPQNIYRLYCPIGNNDRAKAISDIAEELQEISIKQATTAKSELTTQNTWLKVVQSSEDPRNELRDEEILAGAEWIFHKDSETTTTSESMKEDIDSLASRQPEGGARIFAEQAFTILRTAEAESRAQVPGSKGYMSLGSFFTAPRHRKKGLGNLLMEWGVERADEMGLDIWIEAVPSAVPFYERHGFSQLKTVGIDLVCPDGVSERERLQWEEASDYILPVTVVLMYRLAKKDV